MTPLCVPVGSSAPASCGVSMTRGCVATRNDATTGFLSVGRRCLPSDMAERMGCCADLAVAKGLNFGRATERLPTAGLSLSRQIKVLERGSRTVQAVRTLAFRWCAVDDRARPHQDCRLPPRRSRRDGPAAPGSGRPRRQRRSLGGERTIARPALASRGNNRSISTRYASVNGTPGRRSGERKASPQRMPDRGRLGRFS